jgi:hypothetical protein
MNATSPEDQERLLPSRTDWVRGCGLHPGLGLGLGPGGDAIVAKDVRFPVALSSSL